MTEQDPSQPTDSCLPRSARVEESRRLILEDLESVRKRPSMYIGGTDQRGLIRCVVFLVKNSITEHVAGYGNRIEVTIHADGSCSVRDNGRGISLDIHEESGLPVIELAFTSIRVGGKFGRWAYEYNGGLHGVGAKCVNALSAWFKATVFHDGKVHSIRFERGKTTDCLKEVGSLEKPNETGTLVTFLLDATIFTETIEFDYDELALRLRELANCHQGLLITLTDQRGGNLVTESIGFVDPNL